MVISCNVNWNWDLLPTKISAAVIAVPAMVTPVHLYNPLSSLVALRMISSPLLLLLLMVILSFTIMAVVWFDCTSPLHHVMLTGRVLEKAHCSVTVSPVTAYLSSAAVDTTGGSKML